MKSIVGVVSIALGFAVTAVRAEETRESKLTELEAIKAELKPLRAKAYLEPEVVATRQKLDAAYKAYWESVRVAMLRLDPSKKPLIEKDIALRQETGAIRTGAAPKKSP